MWRLAVHALLCARAHAGGTGCHGDITITGALRDLGEYGCASISGSLLIMHTAGLETLDVLRGLKSVGGDLIITDNAALRDIRGLAELTSIGGSLDLSNNQVLQSLEGLEALSSVGGNVNFQHNGITDLVALQGLKSVGGDLTLIPADSAELRIIHLHGAALPPSCRTGRGREVCLGAEERTVHMPIERVEL